MTSTAELPAPSDVAPRLRALAESWSAVQANERASFQTWLIRFCEALGVAPPDPPADAYRFELAVNVMDREGRESTNFIDLWKADHFALEAKASEHGKRDDVLMRKAYGQVRNYVAHVSGNPPPYLMVLDVARTLIVWDRWSGSYGDYAAGRRIVLSTLHDRPDDIALVQDIFARPSRRDPRATAQLVTRDIAGRLARLAAALEARGTDQERVARFLMRCVFSCFAEDVGLLPKDLFRQTLETAKSSGDHQQLTRALTGLWQTMDSGGMFGAALLHRFNGHFFKTVEALPLEPSDVELLIEASGYDWARVEPSIFGTLLVRALDPEERHRLGAEYTPREYIERLVEPTVVEPIRERWTAVQAAVLQLEESGKKKDEKAATQQLLDFHAWLRGLQFLDPACGSGNFLYVTMAAVKRVEMEVLNELDRVSHHQGGLVLDEVHPRQFHGIEIKPWAREIAELTLWIGYHQFWRETHGGRTPPDPILEDTGTLECRDAVLAYDAVVHRPEKDRPDATPRIVHPVTGELVPDPNAKLPYYEYVNARQAEWPRADFIIGNPPYIGKSRQRDALGEGYLDCLRGTYSQLPDSSDFVMYWWSRAARLVAERGCLAAGLITTNSIVQKFHQPIIRDAFERGARIQWAIPDHPWVGESDGAAVRVAMTVLSRRSGEARLLTVNDAADLTSERSVRHLNPDLTSGVDVAMTASVPLASNSGLAIPGFQLDGDGFVLEAHEATLLLASDPSLEHVVRPYLNGRDLNQRSRGNCVIDFGMRDEHEARNFAILFDIVRDRVRPTRATSRASAEREYWWRFARPRPSLRDSLLGLSRFIGTTRTSRHRLFSFVDARVACDSKIVCISSDSASLLGVLASLVHVTWANALGGRLGVGNDFSYDKAACFDAFPLPLIETVAHGSIATLAEHLDSHRKSALARDTRVTMTGMYNVIEKLRANTPLTPKERTIHELAACGVLRDLHDELDRLVAEAYGWPWPMEKEEILERLVALHDERVEEEKHGLIRWLRPEYQIPRFAPERVEATLAIDDSTTALPEPARVLPPWPATAVEQLAAIGAQVAQRALSANEVAASFSGAREDLVIRHLGTLALMGEIVCEADGRYANGRKVA